MDIACLQDESLKLNCSYRLLAAGELSSAVAELNGQAVEGRITTSYPGDADSTAILILIDTSDPARQPVIEKNISHIDAPHHRFALGDSEIRHAVDETPWRIGRSRNNDLTLSDH